MTTEIPSSCLPDKYLTKSHLQELFNDFNASMTSSRPAASIFSSLVNSVRLAYTTPLLMAKEELLDQSKEYARWLIELKHEHGEAIPRAGEIPTPAGEVESTGGSLEEEITKPTPSIDPAWPAVNTFTLHIFSSPDHGRRDWPDWSDTFKDEIGEVWSRRMDLKVFKFQEPGLVSISVYRKRSPVRSLALRDGPPDHWWKDHITFWAFDSPRPGTQMIWSGYRDGPERGILVKGDQSEGMENWERKCTFWVPV